MATRAEVEQARRALNRISAAATSDLRTLLARIDPEDRAELERLLRVAYPALVAEYGTAAAALGADMAEAWASDLGVRPNLAMAPALTTEQAIGVASWSLARPGPLASLTVMTDQVVKQPYRDTVQASAHASNLAWARVPTGAETCAFCVMAASRGAVYKTQQTAGADRKFHGDCDCAVVMVRDESDYPEGYDPAAYFDVYSAGRSIAESDLPPRQSPTTAAILSAMRQVADVH